MRSEGPPPAPLTLRDGKLCFQRLGALNAPSRRHVRDRSIRTPPERRGLWAFPFGYLDLFFAFHKYQEVMPKHLHREAIAAVEDPDLSNALWAERERWMADVAPRAMPMRTFWQGGQVYTRLTASGEDLGSSEWNRMEVPLFLKAARKHLASPLGPRYEADPYFGIVHQNSDALEVFLPLGRR